MTVAAILLTARATAGPPYDTDDPEPTEPGRWEIYGFAAGEEVDGDVGGSTGFDLNYGPAKDVQLTATLPVDFFRSASNGRWVSGAGDVEFGIKYRFFHDDKAAVAIAIFPRVILPSASRRFGSGHAQLRIPIWAGKGFGSWSVFGGGGYEINPGAGNRDFWQGGVAVTHDFSNRLSMGGEVTRHGRDVAGGHAATTLGLGGTYSLGGPFSLLVSGGPTFEVGRRTGLHGYAALGLEF